MPKPDQDPQRRAPYGLSRAVAAGLLINMLLSPPAGAARSHDKARSHRRSIGIIERTVDTRLAANQLAPTANGTLTVTVTEPNPFTGQPQTTTDKVPNPLVEPITSTGKLKSHGNHLMDGDFVFGYLNVMNPRPDAQFYSPSTTTVQFQPAHHGAQIRYVKFGNLPGEPGRLDYGHPLNPQSQPYPDGETFGISMPAQGEPPTHPPQE